MASRICTVVDSHRPALVSEVMQATLRHFEHIAIGALLSIEISVRKNRRILNPSTFLDWRHCNVKSEALLVLE